MANAAQQDPRIPSSAQFLPDDLNDDDPVPPCPSPLRITLDPPQIASTPGPASRPAQRAGSGASHQTPPATDRSLEVNLSYNIKIHLDEIKAEKLYLFKSKQDGPPVQVNVADRMNVGLTIEGGAGDREMNTLRRLCWGLRLQSDILDHTFKQTETLLPRKVPITFRVNTKGRVYGYQLLFNFTARCSLGVTPSRQGSATEPSASTEERAQPNSDIGSTDIRFTIRSLWHYMSGSSHEQPFIFTQANPSYQEAELHTRRLREVLQSTQALLALLD